MEETSFNLQTFIDVRKVAMALLVCDEQGVEFALSVFSGLRRFYEYYITFPEIHAYVSNEDVKTVIPHGRGPIRLNLLCPDHPSILKDVKEMGGFWVCSPVQVVIDLFCSGSGRDAAIKLLELLHDGKL